MFRGAYSSLIAILAGREQQATFTKFWVAHSVSLAGSAITSLALPLTAVLLFSASSAQLGMLIAAQQAPIFLLSLLAGVWVDRFPPKRTLVAMDLGLAVLTGSIPIFAALDCLSLLYLYVCGFCIGSLAVVSRLAKAAYLVTILPSKHLLNGNARLQVSQSLSGVLGPSIAGFVIQLMSAPVALVLDGFSFVVSAVLVWRTAGSESSIERPSQQRMWHGIAEGLRFVEQDFVLKRLAVVSMFATLGAFMQQSVLLIYLSRVLELTPATIGIVYSALGAGAVAGASSASLFARRHGLRAALIAGTLLPSCGMLLIPFAGMIVHSLPVLLLAQLMIGLGASLYYVCESTIRQSRTPGVMMGRAASVRSFVAGSFSPIGALVGGGIGQVFGTPAALQTGALLMGIAMVLTMQNGDRWKSV